MKIQPSFQGRVCYAGKQDGVDSLAGTADWTGKVRLGSAGTRGGPLACGARCKAPRRTACRHSLLPSRRPMPQHIVVMGSGSFAIEAAEAAAKRNARRVTIVSRPRYRHAHGVGEWAQSRHAPR